MIDVIIKLYSVYRFYIQVILLHNIYNFMYLLKFYFYLHFIKKINKKKHEAVKSLIVEIFSCA